MAVRDQGFAAFGVYVVDHRPRFGQRAEWRWNGQSGQLGHARGSQEFKARARGEYSGLFGRAQHKTP